VTGGLPDPTELDLAEALKGLARARAEARPSSITSALMRVGQIHSTRLEAEPALAAFQEVRSLGVRLGERYDVAAADDLIGLLWCHVGEPLRALELHQRAAAEFASLGCFPDESLARSFAAWALLELERPAEALVEARLAAQVEPGSGLGGTMGIALADLGRLDEARHHVEPLPGPGEGAFPWFARVAAHVAARAGDVDGASEMFLQALQVLELTGDKAEYRCCLRQMQRLGLPGVATDRRL
jgi:tetratricopeptide (TPR) repeat protein